MTQTSTAKIGVEKWNLLQYRKAGEHAKKVSEDAKHKGRTEWWIHSFPEQNMEITLLESQAGTSDTNCRLSSSWQTKGSLRKVHMHLW
jgi:hypothetical protein